MGFADDDDNLPDWLSDLNASAASNPPAPEPEDDAPDWLAAATPETPAAPAGGLFDALGDEDDEDVPDWLANIRTSEGRAPNEEPPPPIQPISFEPQAEESADWLEPIRARESGSLPPLDEDGPDFETRLKTLKAQDAPEEEPDASGDWLAGLNIPAEPAAAPASDAGGDWMAGLNLPADEPAASGAGFPLPEPEDKPDWLQEVGSGLGLGLTGAPAGESAPAWMTGVESSPEDEATPDLPEWAAAAASEAAEAVESEFPGLASEPGLGSDVPNWLTEFRPDAEAVEANAFASDYDEAASEVFKLDSGELPDWLAQISPEDALPPPPEPEPAARPVVVDDDTGDLAPAELPSWLQEMRPVASVDAADLQDDETAEAERVGPLAGLSGVLPAEPEIVQFGRPPSAASGLQLSEIQRGYSLQLAQMVAEEVRPVRPTRKTSALPQRLVQVALALTLMVAVTLPLVLLGNFIGLPQTAGGNTPAEIQAALDVVNGLPPGSLVLVALEYQPAFSGEVEAAAMGLIDHLIIGGARLALISSLPSGPAQIENLMATSQRINHPDYQAGRDYYNLGYLPGGVSGLLQLATDPRTAITYRLPDGSDIWAQTAFANIFRVRDFAAIVVLADDPDAARAWVEQVQPALVDPISGRTTPLLVVSSAQAEPLLWPYVQNEPSQIQGLVAGLRGGAYYEASIRELRVRRYWDAYTAGLVVVVASLLIGGGLGLSRSLAGGLKRNKGGVA